MIDGGRTDRAERFIATSPEEVWAAQTDPDRLVRWLPPDDATMEVLAFDPTPGGAYRLRLTFTETGVGKTQADTDEVHGRFVALDEPTRIVQEVDFVSTDDAYAGTMCMTWDHIAAAGGTKVSVTAKNVPPGIDRAVHEAALASSLAKLAAEVGG
ncbi:activator of Hsp90 ATPase-like protein [Maritimibacter alkaliphilus HTCC2654]|uniref:Activator of Hsp90 ATPase homologue 1/2-like C-terminal domain-containing protein n=1 Tax=Maritimibacter alkaliphilus HTCC2654 TaxID=314271 RepID=A3V9M5_9RHOB|nr:SRPBCC family protein [Maritimibacter alkaliphilus]EAQ14616.1 hypothetical protein RB2654_18573 [Maritimibacter alkaliphilus HTCC2654]TYP82212.1 activator of Hsp90 ATPase-like protein [Maritimibacter alkaliphilus HTCC2654]